MMNRRESRRMTMLQTVEQYITALGITFTLGEKINLGIRLTRYCRNLGLSTGKGNTGNAYPKQALEYFLPEITGEGIMEIPAPPPPPLSDHPVIAFIQILDRRGLQGVERGWVWNILYRAALGCTGFEYKARNPIDKDIPLWKAIPLPQQEWLLGRLKWIVQYQDGHENIEQVIADSIDDLAPPKPNYKLEQQPKLRIV
jgi:hypothetical protein